jgi:hypothetical protein
MLQILIVIIIRARYGLVITLWALIWAAQIVGGPYLGAIRALKVCPKVCVSKSVCVHRCVQNLGGPNVGLPLLWAALIVGARGPSAQIRADKVSIYCTHFI